MQIVIDLDDERYKDLMQTGENTINLGVLLALREAVRNGIPLPKCHGRLVDISPYEQKEAFASSWMLTRKIGQIVKNEECIPLFELPTVIEADKDGKE